MFIRCFYQECDKRYHMLCIEKLGIEHPAVKSIIQGVYKFTCSEHTEVEKEKQLAASKVVADVEPEADASSENEDGIDLNEEEISELMKEIEANDNAQEDKAAI